MELKHELLEGFGNFVVGGAMLDVEKLVGVLKRSAIGTEKGHGCLFLLIVIIVSMMSRIRGKELDWVSPNRGSIIS